jgi:hypothetical protein
MVSSLVYVLIVTPVLFFWIHERRLGLVAADEPMGRVLAAPPPRRQWATGVIVILVVASLGLIGAWRIRQRAGTSAQPQPAGSVLQTVTAGDLAITLSNSSGALRQGANNFRIEFRSSRTNTPVNVGDVTLNAAMTMPGMAMTGTTSITPGERPGIYEAKGDFAMSGSWDMTLEWNGPAGRGSAAFKGSVQ